MLCEISLVDARVRAKPIVDARVRVARLRFTRENRAWFLSSMLGSAQVRAGFAEKTLLRAV